MWHELPLALMLANTAYLCKLWVTKERHADQPLICFLEHVINLLHANKIKFLQLFSIKRKKKIKSSLNRLIRSKKSLQKLTMFHIKTAKS